MLSTETIPVVRAGATKAVRVTDRAAFKNCAPFTVVIPMCNLIEISDKYLKTSRNLYELCRDEPKDPITGPELHKM